MTAMPARGTVRFVGAGPGDPDLITLRGAALLTEADCVVYAGSLVPAALLEHCRADAERIDSASMTLEQIVPLLIERAVAGRAVVRLHSGDPSIYGAIGEQIAALRAADVPVEIVPGVSSFQAAAAALGVELTVPGGTQTVILSRVGTRTEVPPAESAELLAAHRASLCLFLSVARAGEIQAALLTHYPPQTPAAAVYRVSWPDEQIIRCRLDGLADAVARLDRKRTVLLMIGAALDPAPEARSKLYDPAHGHIFRRKGGGACPEP
jgi:precorrin-4/cobalt-precorrin-4 C11-methyltransferase